MPGEIYKFLVLIFVACPHSNAGQTPCESCFVFSPKFFKVNAEHKLKARKHEKSDQIMVIFGK